MQSQSKMVIALAAIHSPDMRETHWQKYATQDNAGHSKSCRAYYFNSTYFRSFFCVCARAAAAVVHNEPMKVPGDLG